jgi:hypothetical protein
MERGDAVRVDPDHPKYGGKRPWQYEWLSAALVRNSPGFDGGWPWWLSCGEPDLDALRSATLPGGREQASIELELPTDRCPTFPLWMWETIHTGYFLASTREELDAWHGELESAGLEPGVWPLPQPWRDRIEESWERIFDEAWRPRCWYHDEAPSVDDTGLGALMREASVEVVGLTQELRAGDAVRVTPFTAAG